MSHNTQDWNQPEDLKPLDITSPDDWNEYDDYLLNGGQLEYEDWRVQGEPQEEGKRIFSIDPVTGETEIYDQEAYRRFIGLDSIATSEVGGDRP